jgi:hypothetical protein
MVGVCSNVTDGTNQHGTRSLSHGDVTMHVTLDRQSDDSSQVSPT